MHGATFRRTRTSIALVVTVALAATVVAVAAPPARAAGLPLLQGTSATTALDPLGDLVTVEGTDFGPNGTVSVRQCTDIDGTLTCSGAHAVTATTSDLGGFTAEVPVSRVTDAFAECLPADCVVRAHDGVGRGPLTHSPWVNFRDGKPDAGSSMCADGTVMTGMDVRTDFLGGDPSRGIVVRAAARCGDLVGPWIGEAPGAVDQTSACAGTSQVIGIGGRHGDLLDLLHVVCREEDALQVPTGAVSQGGDVGDVDGSPGGAPFETVVCPTGMFAVGIDGQLLGAFDNPLQSLRLVCADIGGSRVSIGFSDEAPIELVSRTPYGWSGNEASSAPSMSHDGRYVAFESRATDIVAYSGEIGMPPPRGILVHDRLAASDHTVRLQTPGNAEAWGPWLSGNGHEVAFTTRAALLDVDTDAANDVYVWRLDEPGLELASKGTVGTALTGNADLAALSDNAHFVLFTTVDALVPGDSNELPDLYLRDRRTGEVRLVTVAAEGTPADGQSLVGDVSDDGRWVTFTSAATNLGPPTSATVNVYLRDMVSGEVRLLASQDGGTLPVPRIAADGSTVVVNTADDPVGDGFSAPQAVAYDVATSTYRLVSHAPGADQGTFSGEADAAVRGPAALSPDGRYVAFASAGTNLGDGEAGTSFDVFVHDRVTDTVRHASGSPVASGPGSNADRPAIDASGTIVAFDDTFATYFPSGADPDNDDEIFEGGTPPEASDVYLTTSTPPAASEPRTIDGLGLTATASSGGLPQAGLDTVPIAGIPVESIPFANVAIGAAPLRSIDMSAAPLRSIPLRSIPLRSIPLRSITLSQLPLQLDGGWSPRLVGTSLEGLPLQTITLAQVAEEPAPVGADGQPLPHPLDGIDLSQVGIASSPLRSIGIASIALGSTPLRSIPLRSIDAGADPDAHVCPMTGSVPTTDTEALTNWQDLLVCLGFTGSVDGTTSLIDIDIAGAPLRSIPLRSIPLRSIDLSASPLRSIPLRSIELSATPLRSIPLRSIVLDVQSSPLRSIPLRSIDLVASPLRSIPLRSIPVPGEVVDCTGNGVDCSTDASNTQTLGDVAALNADYVIGQLEDLGAALEGFTLGDLLGETGDATIGTVQDWLNATQGDHISLADVLVGLLLKTDYPWEELPVADMRLQNVAPTADDVSASLSFSVGGSPVAGDQATITVTLPAGAAYEPGSSQLETSAVSDTLGFATLDVRDPSVSGNVLTYQPGSDLAGTTVTLRFDYRPGVRLVDEAVSATVAIGTPGAEPDVTATTADGYTVSERARSDDDPTTAPVLADGDTLVVGHIATAGDIDYYRIPASLVAGKRVSIDLAVPGVDQDLVLYSPVGADGVIDAAPLRSIPLRSIAVEDQGAVTPGETVPPETLQDIPLRSIPLRSISANRDATNESVDVLANQDPDGHYTIQVSGYNGASSTEPYVLRLRVTDPPTELQCPDRTLAQVTAPTTTTATPAPVGTNVLYVVNPSRIDATYGVGQGVRVVDALERLDDDPALGLRGHVLAVDQDEAIRTAYAAWDAATCSPNAANAVVDAIVTAVEASHGSAGGTDADYTIPYVVLVGGDDVLPQARVPDLTRLSNERDYLQDVGTDNPLAGAFATEHLLSDDPYGDRDPIPWLNRLMYVPDASLGRLVETPDEIIAAIDRFIAWDGSLDPSTATGTIAQDALVTGYDFLSDGATAVADELDAALPPNATVDRSLISETWTRQQLVDALLGPDIPYVAAVNAHFDHYRSLPGEGNATHDETDLFVTADVVDPDADPLTPSPKLDQRLLFSMGCHSGLSVPDVYVQGIEDADWAQTLARQGTGAYVGNTGYGYGDTAAVALSERLMAEFAGRLDGTMTVGQAMTYAKHAYAAQLGVYGAYDEKVLAEATFYGLPMFHISDQPSAPADLPEVATNAVSGANTGVAASTFSLDSTDLALRSETAPDGSTFLTAGGQAPQVTSGRPITPRTDRDITAQDGTPARGVLLTALTSDEQPVTNAAFARAVVDHSSREPAVATDVAFPASFASVNRYRDPLGARSQLVLMPGQFVPDGDPATLGHGTQRRFTQMDGIVYYSDDADVTPPTFATTSARANASTVTFAAEVADTDNAVMRVLVLYRDTAGAWKQAELADDGAGRWTGSGPVATDQVEYLVQAVDAAGNVATTTNKGFLFAASVDAVPPTVTVTSPTATTYVVGEQVVADFACEDANPRDCSATVNGVPIEDGQSLDTTTPAAFQVLTVTATDAYGNTTTSSVTFNVGYVFVGFADPVAAGSRTEVKAGSAVPVRWQLRDLHGYVSDRSAITDVRSEPLDCGTGGEATAALETTTEISGLTYDVDTDQWQYVWKTERAWRGTCRQLVVTFSDGQVVSAVFVMK